MRWNRLTIDSSQLAAEAVSAILLPITPGHSEEVGGQGILLRAYLPDDEHLQPVVELIEQRLGELPAELLAEGLPQLTQDWVADEDWAESWKEFYHPLRVGRRLVIKPTWQPWPPVDDPQAARDDDVILELDPGMAFGTGAHPTTRLCLAALEGNLQPGMRVIDLGCGSGILTLGALQLGAGEVLAIDNDPLAIEATRDNCQRAGLTGCTTALQEGLADTAAGWDLVVANISARVISAIAAEVYQLLKPGGLFINSGFFSGSADTITPALEELGYQLKHRADEELWACLVARRPE
jgi:ribosomal protein L11 methyltransferase